MIKEDKKRPVCKRCGINKVKKNGVSKLGFTQYYKYCTSCLKVIYNMKHGNRKVGYRVYKKEHCESCGFIPLDPCQLDVDHIDGDRHNNDLDNLQTLCANCHRLKSKIDRKNKIK